MIKLMYNNLRNLASKVTMFRRRCIRIFATWLQRLLCLSVIGEFSNLVTSQEGREFVNLVTIYETSCQEGQESHVGLKIICTFSWLAWMVLEFHSLLFPFLLGIQKQFPSQKEFIGFCSSKIRRDDLQRYNLNF